MEQEYTNKYGMARFKQFFLAFPILALVEQFSWTNMKIYYYLLKMRIREIIILIYVLKKTYLKEPYQNNTMGIIITKEQDKCS